MSDNKLSLHIGQKNLVTITSGFTDVLVESPNSPLTLNVQRVSNLGDNSGVWGYGVAGTTMGATRTVGRTVPRTHTGPGPYPGPIDWTDTI